MKKYLLLAVLLGWFTCGFFAWGISQAEFRHRNRDYGFLDCRHDQSFSAGWGMMFGPLALGASLMTSGFAEHGIQWTCKGEKP